MYVFRTRTLINKYSFIKLLFYRKTKNTGNIIPVLNLSFYFNPATGNNSSIKSFPTVMYAGVFGFHEKEYFKVEESAKAVPKVSF